MPSTDPVQTQIDQILQRLAALDGQNLATPAQAQIAQLTAMIAGLKKTLGNVNMGYKADIGALQQDYLAFKATVSSLLGITTP